MAPSCLHSVRKRALAKDRVLRSALLLSVVLSYASLSAQTTSPFQAKGMPHSVGNLALDHSSTTWRASDGLPEDTVQALAIPSTDAMWIATTGGLVHFDGSRLVNYAATQHGLPANSIFCLRIAQDGTLWAGTEGAGLLRIDTTGWRAFSAADGIENNFVRAVLEDRRGRLWVGTDDGLYLRNGERFERFSLDAAATEMAVHSLLEARDGTIWVGGSHLYAIGGGVRVGESEIVRRYELPGSYSEKRIKSLAQTSDGVLWVGTVTGLDRLVGNRFKRLPGLKTTIRCLFETSDGVLRIGTIGRGLWEYDNGHLRSSDTAGMLPSETILTIAQDSFQQIWIGTRAGLVRLSDTPVHMIPVPDRGDSDNQTIFGQSLDRQAHAGKTSSQIWVASNHLYVLRAGTLEPVSLPQVGDASLRNVFRSTDGSFWIGTDGRGAYRLHHGQITHLFAPLGLTNNFVRAFLETRNGDLWIATDEGVNRIRDGKTLQLNEANGLAYFSVRCLLEDRTGGVWMGTDSGLSHWLNGRFIADHVTAALAQEQVWVALEDRAGSLWFGTRDHGLYRLQRGILAHVTAAQGLPSDTIYGLVQSGEGSFWLSGPNGVASLSEAAMEAADLGSATHEPLHPTVYQMPFAGQGAQFSGGRQSSAYAAPDGAVWFPTNRGLASISSPAASYDPPARIAIDSASVDGVTAGHDTAKSLGSLDLQARANRLRVEVSVASLHPQPNLRFRWKLDGFDKDWSPAGSERSVTYMNLPAGHYRLHVAAVDADSPAPVSEAELLLVKHPSFYRTFWCYLLGALIAAFLGWAAYRLRVRHIANRFEAVIEERERVAREMHDTLIQGSTSVSALLEALALRRRDATGVEAELLTMAREQTLRTIDEARRAVWNLRHRSRSTDLIAALRDVTSQTSSAGQVRLRSNVPHLTLPSDPANEIIMTVREAVSNALRHSGSSTVSVDLWTSKHELTLCVRDFGCGLTPATKAGSEQHYGILGMRERMKRIGGGLQIDGQPGSGTTVQMQLQWHNMRRRQAVS
jgi:ligand-binding sensor domain-containing protein/signal transduction histidine kinase